MDLPAFERLLTNEGVAALELASRLEPSEAKYLACYDRLRKRFAAELCKAALETCLLRAKAAPRFANASRMFFTKESLEQATSEAVADHRARRFGNFGTVADLGCGIGADAIAMARAGARVTAIDRDPLRLAMAAKNADVCGASIRFVQSDLLADPIPDADAYFADPARRADGKRFLSLEDYVPAPEALLARLPRGAPVAFKLAPGVPHDDIDAHDGEAEFVSLGGELKECTLWLGDLKRTRRRATVLPAGVTLAGDGEREPLDVGSPRAFLYDPDPALTRSGLLADFGAPFGATLLDPGIAYLTADVCERSPFATVYAIDAAMPYHPRRLVEALRARNVGRVTMLRRGSQLEAEAVSRSLKLRGDEHRFVALTRHDGGNFAIIARLATE